MASLIVRSKDKKEKLTKKEAYRGALWNGKDQFAETPTEVMIKLVEEFGLLSDVCPRDPQRNGLEEEWQRVNYMNPPYSQMEAWLTKAVVEWKKNKTVVCLLPARTNTNWFHDICIKYASEIRFIRQGIKFKGYKKKSPFPVALCIFKAEDAKYADTEEVEVKVGSVDFYAKKKCKLEETNEEDNETEV